MSGNKKLDVGALKLGLLSRIAERTKKKVLENRYGEIMRDDNKTHGYYIVNWDRPPHEFQEDTDIFKAGNLFYNATYLNIIHEAHH